MSDTIWWHDLSGLATLIAAVGSAIAAVRASRHAGDAAASSDRTAKRAAATSETVTRELSHNHGSSLKDAVARIETEIAGQARLIEAIDDKVDAVGHQVGEIRADAHAAHQHYDSELAGLRERVWDCQTKHAAPKRQ